GPPPDRDERPRALRAAALRGAARRSGERRARLRLQGRRRREGLRARDQARDREGLLADERLARARDRRARLLPPRSLLPRAGRRPRRGDPVADALIL